MRKKMVQSAAFPAKEISALVDNCQPSLKLSEECHTAIQALSLVSSHTFQESKSRTARRLSLACMHGCGLGQVDVFFRNLTLRVFARTGFPLLHRRTISCRVVPLPFETSFPYP